MKREVHRVTLKRLIESGLITAPLRLQKVFRGRRLTAIVERDGSVTFAARKYGSLSTAGGAARALVLGTKHFPATNGWEFWTFESSGGSFAQMGVLRTEYLQRSNVQDKA